MSQHGHQEISANFNETPQAKQKYQNQSEHTSGSTEVQSTEPPKVVLHKPPTEGRSSLNESRERENGKLQLCPSPVQVPLSQINISAPEPPLETGLPSEKSLTEPRGGHLSTFRQPSVVEELTNIGSNAKLSSKAASEQQRAKGRRLPCSTSNPSILPRPPVLPGIRPACRGGSQGGEGAALCLLDLQNSFSKSKAHHEFNRSITLAAVNLRDNVVTGKKHDFYGINCYHLHG
ncbi:spmip4 [Pungitius sinensis]